MNKSILSETDIKKLKKILPRIYLDVKPELLKKLADSIRPNKPELVSI